MAWLGAAGLGSARHGVAWQGRARHGKVSFTQTMDTQKLNPFYNEVDPRNLKPHPANKRIYGHESIDQELLKSIRELGVLEPLVITTDNLVIAGHRRRVHAIEAGLETVPVRIVSGLNELEIERWLIVSNKQRVKTNEQRAREYERLKAIYAELAKERQHAAGEHGKEGGRGNTKPSKNKDVNPSAEFSGRVSESREQAAVDVGMKRDTAEKAAKVVEKIDEAEAAGDTETAEELRETLNTKSVNAAAKKAGTVGTKKASGKKGKAKETSVATLVDNLFRSHVGHVARGLTGIAEANGGEGPQFRRADEGLNDLIGAMKEMREGAR